MRTKLSRLVLLGKSPDDFSLSALLNSARVANEWEDPKYVVQPSRVRSVWLHWPGIINRGRMVTVDDDLNFMLHFRNWSMVGGVFFKERHTCLLLLLV